MPINIVLGDTLAQEPMRLSGARTPKALILKALEKFVKNRKRLNLLDLDGKIEFLDGYDARKIF